VSFAASFYRGYTRSANQEPIMPLYLEILDPDFSTTESTIRERAGFRTLSRWTSEGTGEHVHLVDAPDELPAATVATRFVRILSF
jgi:hypothetical protein